MLDFHIARPEEKAEAFAQVHPVWPHAVDPDVHLMKRLHAVQQNRAEWFVGRSPNGVEVSLAAYPFTIFGPTKEKRPVRGLGAIYTHPRARGNGYAAQLIAFVRAHYRKQGIEDFILYSDIEPTFYERLGFHRLASNAFEFEAKALRKDSPWSHEPVDALIEDPGRMGHDFGLDLTKEDLIWGAAKQDQRLRMTRFKNKAENLSYWALSILEEGNYILLMSNIPQDERNWKNFQDLIAADSAIINAKKAKGWLSPPSIPRQGELEQTIKDRKDGILMWASSQGEKDPWYPEICKKGFLSFPLLQF